MILPALTLDRFVAVDIFEGVCDKKRFVDFILDQVVYIIINYENIQFFYFYFLLKNFIINRYP